MVKKKNKLDYFVIDERSYMCARMQKKTQEIHGHGEEEREDDDEGKKLSYQQQKII